VDWHLNLPSKNSKHVETKALAAKETPILAIADKLEVVDSTSSGNRVSVVNNISKVESKSVEKQNQKPSKVDAKSHSTRESRTSKLANGISKSILKLEIVEKIAPKLSKSLSSNPNQIKPNNNDHHSHKGVWSFILVLSTWALVFFVLIIAFGSGGGEFLAVILLIMAGISAIASLVLGLSAIFDSQDTVDLVFGILGTLLILLTFAVLIGAIFGF